MFLPTSIFINRIIHWTRLTWWDWLLTRTRALEQDIQLFHSIYWLIYAFLLLSHPYRWFYPLQQPYKQLLGLLCQGDHNSPFAGSQFGTNCTIYLCHINSFWQTNKAFSYLSMCHLSQARTLVYIVLQWSGVLGHSVINYVTYYSKSFYNIGRYYKFFKIVGLFTYKKASSFFFILFADFRIQLIPLL